MWKECTALIARTVVGLLASTPVWSAEWVPAKAPESLRIATFNASLNRSQAGELARQLQAGDAQIERVAAVIRAVQPDILLLNEIDFSETENNARHFADRYLAAEKTDALGGKAWPMPHHFSAEVNTGQPSGLDLDGDGSLDGPQDAWGFGLFPGQYGMALFSRFPIEIDNVRCLQTLRWASMPEPQVPRAPGADSDYYPPAVWQSLRLPSKSFWDVPIDTPLGHLHALASHPTPPAFDGAEDRNGCRNHDEIRLIIDYIDAQDYLKCDMGKPAGLREDDAFVVLGDLNSDPCDGDSRYGAIRGLLAHPRLAPHAPPRSAGGLAAADAQGGRNRTQQGDPAEDTADFNDRSVGNLRVDYVLPSDRFRVVNSGVFWPSLEDLPLEMRPALQTCLDASDHRLVWVDVQRAGS